jgi:hypothetical protein
MNSFEGVEIGFKGPSYCLKESLSGREKVLKSINFLEVAV